MTSIIQKDLDACFLCGAVATETHHVFGGAMRSKSDRLGLVVRLCHCCHNEPPIKGISIGGVHHCRAKMEFLHRVGQMAAMEKYGWSTDDFRKEFYKNYLEDDTGYA